jgi:amidase
VLTLLAVLLTPENSISRFSCTFLPRQRKMEPAFNVLTATADELQHMLSPTSSTAPKIDSKYLVKQYLTQINRHDNYLRAVISTAPKSLLWKRADWLDQELAVGMIRSPLHGIPVIVKDNIATTPALGLDTTAGSLALVGSKPRSNAAVVDRVSHPILALSLRPRLQLIVGVI